MSIKNCDKCVLAYNSTLKDLLREAKELCPDLGIDTKVDLFNGDHIRTTAENVSSLTVGQLVDTDLLQVSEVSSMKLSGKVTVTDLVSALSSVEIPTVRSYVALLVSMSTLFASDDFSCFDVLINNTQKLQEGAKAADCLTGNALQDAILKNLEQKKGGEEDGPTAANNFANVLKDTKIGALAKEVVDELDLGSINPEMILGGSAGKDLIGKIVSKVGGKLQDRLSNGNLNQAAYKVSAPHPGLTMIVIPQHLVLQWQEAIEKYHTLETWNATTYMGYSDLLLDPVSNLKGLDILLTTPAMLHHLQAIEPYRVVFDEILACPVEKLSASLMWFVSASLVKEELSHNECRCQPDFIAESFQALRLGIEDYKVTTLRCKNPVTTRVLSQIIAPSKLTSLFACDYGSGILDASGLLKTIREDLDTKIKEQSAELDLVTKRRVRKTKQQVDELAAMLTKNRASMQKLTTKSRDAGVCAKCCNHITGLAFEFNCSKDVLCGKCCTKVCQACKTEDCSSTLVSVPVYTDDDLNDKLQILTNLVKNADPNAKIVIVSAFGFEFLRNHWMQYEFEDPQKWKNSSDPNDFGKVPLFLMDPRIYACGLNLHETTDLVLLHRLTTTMERQVIGRAQRPPRVGTLRVWKLRYDVEVAAQT
ncbi:hypothetical protein CEUSTIGMA_g12569.t1 [Chlamydomonas eustigma]|uniref:Uncharacterized protein n=1 Tax=Chlamydomonas eustigma TaxID=1157962 RepID=A0A250XQS2_9CHLO|nr:hypothetical protein CEUSTIGMA_g12569.t1 [Chlamydomonas eustigma]|eukprot:GAX85150.1 hypothetical protein CEUSTIGMA_g12569.t1 [Chlamydomonas eustigma]